MTIALALLLLGQPAPGATLRVTVVDQTGAVVVGATVTVSGAEAQTSSTAIPGQDSNEAGVATFAGLTPGRYTITAAFPGFETRIISGVRIRAGENRQVAALAIQRVQADVTVELDRQQAASDRRGAAFGSTLTREQIDALSDDPAMLKQQLEEMAGPGAVIRIDGFEGGALPPKAMIRSIRIARDQFAAEFHSAGGVSVEIITQPGSGPMRYFSNMMIRPNRFIARSPFVPVRGPEQHVNYGIGANGTLRKDKSSFFLNVFGLNAYDTPNLNAAGPGGTRALALGLRAPRNNMSINGQVDYALTLDHSLRMGYTMSRFAQDNQGIGGYDEPERAFRTENQTHMARVQHYGPVGRRAFWRSRMQFVRNDSDALSAIETPTIRVLDAFTSGGAQRDGGDHGRTLNVASDLDYVRGRHSMRFGAVIDSAWNRSDSVANYLGTYTFNSLDAYVAQTPSNYSRRIGNPAIDYRMVQVGVYVQDDIRLHKSLSLTPGLRYEWQSHVDNALNLGPRFGVTWAPTRSGQLTLRGSVGVFYDWLSTGTYDQVLRIDGFRQQELNLVDPVFDMSAPPVLSSSGVRPVNRYLLGQQYDNPRISRASAAIERTFKRVNRVSATYSYMRGSRLARGRNVNPLAGGRRPDPRFANVIEVAADGASRQHQVQFDAVIAPGALFPTRGPRIDWKRTSLFANYTLGMARNNTDGAFTVTPTGVLATEWGPASGGGFAGPSFFAPGAVIIIGGSGPLADVRHRANLTLNAQVVRNVPIGIQWNASSAPPYTLLTGRDDNSDGIFNDRPSGVGRNTLRAAGQSVVALSAGYQFEFGRSSRPLPPGVAIFGGGGSPQVRTVDMGQARYRAQVMVQVQNALNRSNYVGYSGTMTSPFFGRPTAAGEMRKVQIIASFSF